MLIKNSLLLGLVMLSGCASILDGRSQEVMVNSSPDGASCNLTRNNESLGTISPTPGSIYIEKTKYNILMNCTKDGYEPATYVDKSGIDGAVWGNILLGGLIGWGIDSASGADNHYDSPVNITLSKK